MNIRFLKTWSNKILSFYRVYGLKQTFIRIITKITKKEIITYKKWCKKHFVNAQEIRYQRAHEFVYQPKISIVVPLYNTPYKFLDELIGSIQNQTYDNWELCLSDGSGIDSPLESILKEYEVKDARIKVAYNQRTLCISENTNCALELATGDFVAFVDHDDLLAVNALYECVSELNSNPAIEIIYTDEDKIDMSSKEHFMPHFKSDFNMDLLRSMNYISHLFFVKKEILKQVGILRKEYDGAQDYDLILRCVEQAKIIYHIPKILYHWRAHQNSTAENPGNKIYAFEAGKRAIEAHLERCGIRGVVSMGQDLGLYRVQYLIEKEPVVSILIPNKDHKEDLERCIQSLFDVSIYKSFEIIVIENGSVEESTFQYYEQLCNSHDNVKVVTWVANDGFNFSALNNFGAAYANGEYLLFLNNDTEILKKDAILEMVSHASRKEVGAVGARLYYPDGTVQHAGVIVGLGGIAGHAFKDFPRQNGGYFYRSFCIQDYSAVTAACMMMSKKLFDEIGGFDEKLKVAFNDIDLCMEIRKRDKLIVYTPYAELYHYESKSRGLENTKEKVQRFNSEVEYFAKKWKNELNAGDPYYNINLTLEKHDFSLKIL